MEITYRLTQEWNAQILFVLLKMFHICPGKLTDWWWAIEFQSFIMLVTPKHYSITIITMLLNLGQGDTGVLEEKTLSICCSTATNVGPSLILTWIWTHLRCEREDDPLLRRLEEDEASSHSSSLLEQSCHASRMDRGTVEAKGIKTVRLYHMEVTSGGQKMVISKW